MGGETCERSGPPCECSARAKGEHIIEQACPLLAPATLYSRAPGRAARGGGALLRARPRVGLTTHAAAAAHVHMPVFAKHLVMS